MAEATREERLKRVSWGSAKIARITQGAVSGATVYAKVAYGVYPKMLERAILRMTLPHSNFGLEYSIAAGADDPVASVGFGKATLIAVVGMVDEFQTVELDFLNLMSPNAVFIKIVNFTVDTQTVLGHLLYREVEDLTQVSDPMRLGCRG